MSRRTKERKPPEGFENERPEPLELIAKMVVGGGYRMPVEGVGSKASLTSSDVAGAMGMMGERTDVAIAVATAAEDPEIARLVGRVYAHVHRAVRAARPSPLALSRASDRYRLRIVTFDAAKYLVRPDDRPPFRELARAAKMRADTYYDAYKIASSVLHEMKANANREFGFRMFGSGEKREDVPHDD